MAKKRIIMVDDQPLISTLIQEFLVEDPDVEIAQMTNSKEEFFAAIEKHPFDIALVDISIGESEGGLKIINALKEKSINLPAVVLSAHDESLYALKCLKAGAKGYISKECICDDLVSGLKQILQGSLFVSGAEGKKILKQYEQLNVS